MAFINFLFNSIFDVAATNIDVLGYPVSILEIAIFVMLGSVAIVVILGR